MDTPKYYEFMNPTLQALREGGDTLTNDEIVDTVAQIMHLPDEVMERRQAGHHNMRECEYRIAWAKSYLKQAGYLTQSTRGVWALTPEGKAVDAVDEHTIVVEVRRAYRARHKVQKAGQQPEESIEFIELDTEEVPGADALAEVEAELSWKEQVLAAVLAMSPKCQNMCEDRRLCRIHFHSMYPPGLRGPNPPQRAKKGPFFGDSLGKEGRKSTPVTPPSLHIPPSARRQIHQ